MKDSIATRRNPRNPRNHWRWLLLGPTNVLADDTRDPSENYLLLSALDLGVLDEKGFELLHRIGQRVVSQC